MRLALLVAGAWALVACSSAESKPSTFTDRAPTETTSDSLPSLPAEPVVVLETPAPVAETPPAKDGDAGAPTTDTDAATPVIEECPPSDATCETKAAILNTAPAWLKSCLLGLVCEIPEGESVPAWMRECFSGGACVSPDQAQ